MRILALVLLLSASGCIPEQRLPLPETFHSIVLSTADGSRGGSACPVNGGNVAVTAKHVVEIPVDIWLDPLSPAIHPVRIMYKDPTHDWATVMPEEGLFPHPVPVAKHGPVSGEEVILHGMVEEQMAVFYGHVASFAPEGDLLVDIAGYPGSSGGCVISAKTGELYGILLGGRIYQGGARPLARVEPLWGKKF